jgi:hypothetical protein
MTLPRLSLARPSLARPSLARLALAGLATSALVLSGGPALASHGGHGGQVTKSGSCSDGARWKVKAKPDDNRIEVEGEVDSNTAGQTWAWKILDDGAKVSSGGSMTAGRSGSFSIERRITDRAGSDSITFRATHAGEVCTGTVTL